MNDLFEPTYGAIFFLLLGALLLVVLTIRYRRKEAHPQIRELIGLRKLRDELGRAAESGRPIHIALGNGALSSGDTITSLAGLQGLEGLVDATVGYNVAPIMTVGDSTLLPLAQDALRRAYKRRQALELFDPSQVRFVAPSPLAYAAGADSVGAAEDTIATVAAGAYGSEVSLIADSSVRRRVHQWAGVDSAEAIGALYPATEHLTVGEELYAVGAQLAKKDKYTTSLIAEDILRFVLALAILGVAVWAFFAS